MHDPDLPGDDRVHVLVDGQSVVKGLAHRVFEGHAVAEDGVDPGAHVQPGENPHDPGLLHLPGGRTNLDIDRPDTTWPRTHQALVRKSLLFVTVGMVRMEEHLEEDGLVLVGGVPADDDAVPMAADQAAGAKAADGAVVAPVAAGGAAAAGPDAEAVRREHAQDDVLFAPVRPESPDHPDDVLLQLLLPQFDPGELQDRGHPPVLGHGSGFPGSIPSQPNRS